MRVDEGHELETDDENAWCSCGFDLPPGSEERLLVWSRHLGARWIQWSVEELHLAGEVRDQLTELARHLDGTAWSGVATS